MRQFKIGLIGPQGSGKTTVALQLVAELKKEGYDAELISEVARSSPLQINESATKKSQTWILGMTLAKEQECKAEILVCDRTLLDAFCYSYRVDKEYFKTIMPFIKEYMRSYNIVFYMPPNDNYLKDDGVRSINKAFRDEIDSLILGFLNKLNVKHTITEGHFEYTKQELIKWESYQA
jgi:nicotinamide riboside kinase